jgi:type IV pilus assembly protein PilF
VSLRLRRLYAYAALLSFLFLTACAGVVNADQSVPVVSAADAASSVNQRRADVHLQLALAYYQQSQWQVALDEATSALQIAPPGGDVKADALSMRGLILMASGRPVLAGPEFLQALQIAPDQPDYLNNYAWFLCQTGHARASLNWFERAAGQPDYQVPEKALNNAGSCSQTAGDDVAAKGYFARALALQPGNARSNTALAKIYFNDGDYSRARFHAERATAGSTPDVDALWIAIKVARKSDRAATETQLLAQLRTLYPASAEYAAYQRGAFDE